MSELLARHDFLVFLGLMLPCVLAAWIAVAAINSHHGFVTRKAELDAALKQDMLQRGMSADDIVRVVAAGPTPAAAPTADDRRHELVREMIGREMTGEDIARVVAALAARATRIGPAPSEPRP